MKDFQTLAAKLKQRERGGERERENEPVEVCTHVWACANALCFRVLSKPTTLPLNRPFAQWRPVGCQNSLPNHSWIKLYLKIQVDWSGNRNKLKGVTPAVQRSVDLKSVLVYECSRWLQFNHTVEPRNNVFRFELTCYFWCIPVKVSACLSNLLHFQPSGWCHHSIAMLKCSVSMQSHCSASEQRDMVERIFCSSSLQYWTMERETVPSMNCTLQGRNKHVVYQNCWTNWTLVNKLEF